MNRKFINENPFEIICGIYFLRYGLESIFFWLNFSLPGIKYFPSKEMTSVILLSFYVIVRVIDGLRADKKFVSEFEFKPRLRSTFETSANLILIALIFSYEKKQSTVEETAAKIVTLVKTNYFKKHFKKEDDAERTRYQLHEANRLDLLSYLVKHRPKNSSCFDSLIKEVCAKIDIDITIEKMYKLLPQEDFSLFDYIYNIHLRDLFKNHEFYPSDEGKIIEYADDYMKNISDMLNKFPECYATYGMAFHFLKGHYPQHCSKKGRDAQISFGNKHPFKDTEKLKHDDIVALDDQKLKYCNQALIYGFKMHTLDVLYKEDPNSPLIKILLTTFNDEEKTKSKYNEWVRSFGRTSPISVSMFGNESKEAASTDIDFNKGA